MASPPDHAAPKTEWRRWARALPPVDGHRAGRVTTHLARLLDGLGRPVLGYLSLQDEVPLGDLVARCECLPRLAEDGTMSIHLDGVHADASPAEPARERHETGLEQPRAGLPVVEPSALAVVLVPGRVFDLDGYRLGRGGGHYDRLLPQLSPGTPVIGVTTWDRVVPRLPREPHDRPMTHLVTEVGARTVAPAPNP